MTDIKTTHVGSLPRPQEMINKVLRKQDVSRDDIRGYLTDIVEKQLSLGLTYINNGELPRADYVSATVNRIAGFGGSGTAPSPRDLDELPEFSRRFGGRNGLITLNPKARVKLPVCLEPLSYAGEAALREELEMLRDVVNESPQASAPSDNGLFFTSPSPGTVALFMENQYHPSYGDYLENISTVLKREYEMIASYGFQLQVDCPDLAMGRHTRYKSLSDKEFLTIVDSNVQALNQALENIDTKMCRAHICWGNYPGTHHCDIDFKTIFTHVMKIDATFISLEASNHRHAHEWEVFETLPLPDDKVLMPGVVDTTSTIVEHPDLVEQRLSNYIALLGPERVVGSTDCGFATTATATSVTGEVAWMKLASLVEGAKRAGKKYT